jgi:hypothetical protein
MDHSTSSYPTWKKSKSSYRISRIREIAPQIKTFYQPLIAVQTNYTLAKLCQWLPGVLLQNFELGNASSFCQHQVVSAIEIQLQLILASMMCSA